MSESTEPAAEPVPLKRLQESNPRRWGKTAMMRFQAGGDIRAGEWVTVDPNTGTLVPEPYEGRIEPAADLGRLIDLGPVNPLPEVRVRANAGIGEGHTLQYVDALGAVTRWHVTGTSEPDEVGTVALILEVKP